MNILLTSVGRRTYMVDYFKNALGKEGMVYAANSCCSPALMCADRQLITPRIYSDEYIPFLLRHCGELNVNLIVSFFDIDMPVLSGHRDEFEAAGIRLAMSDDEFYEICSDKYYMCKSLSEHDFDVPESFISADGIAEYPLIIKPRFGMGSLGVYKAENEIELRGAISMCRRSIGSGYLRYESETVNECDSVIIQKMLFGNEYGLDVISDLDGRYVNTIVRRKLAMRSGETDEAIVLDGSDPEYDKLSALGAKFAAVYKPKGLTDMDVIISTDGIACIIDINGRFGGGYPFSHIAGADVPKAYILWTQGRVEEADECCFTKRRVHGYKDIIPRAY